MGKNRRNRGKNQRKTSEKLAKKNAVEEDFVENGFTLEACAKKHSIPFETLKSRHYNDKWAEKRKQYQALQKIARWKSKLEQIEKGNQKFLSCYEILGQKCEQIAKRFNTADFSPKDFKYLVDSILNASKIKTEVAPKVDEAELKEVRRAIGEINEKLNQNGLQI